MDLCAVVVLDAGEEFPEQLDELRGALVGEAGQPQGQDHGFAFQGSAVRFWRASVGHDCGGAFSAG